MSATLSPPGVQQRIIERGEGFAKQAKPITPIGSARLHAAARDSKQPVNLLPHRRTMHGTSSPTTRAPFFAMVAPLLPSHPSLPPT